MCNMSLFYIFRISLTDCEHFLAEVNPRYVLRNWMAESAITKAEKNDFSEVCI